MRALTLAVWIVALATLVTEVEAKGSSGDAGFGRAPAGGRSSSRAGGFKGSAFKGSAFRGSGFSDNRSARPAARPVTRSAQAPAGRSARDSVATQPRGIEPRTRRSNTNERTRATNGGRWSSTLPSNRSARDTRTATPTNGGRSSDGVPGRSSRSGLSTREYLASRFSGQSRRASRPDSAAVGTRSATRGAENHARTRTGLDGTARGRSRGGEAYAQGALAGVGQQTGYRSGTIRIGVSSRGWYGYGYGYGGCGFYRPYYNCGTGRYCGFYYASPVTYCYVPYGFYGGASTVYVDSYDSVSNDYSVNRYQPAAATEPVTQGAAASDAASNESVSAAAGSAAAERYMRDATAMFANREYPEAARQFRLAAIAAPDKAGPLFALGQGLIALKNYPYAAKVIRQAIAMEPSLVNEGGDLVAVYGDREEFDRVTGELQQQMKARPAEIHAAFLLGVQQYFSADPAARDTFADLALRDGSDPIVLTMLDASERRFAKARELPPIEVK